jgi:hypothetical protein
MTKSEVGADRHGLRARSANVAARHLITREQKTGAGFPLRLPQTTN